MACPACFCNETYAYDDGEDIYDLCGELICCAACGAIFETEDEAPGPASDDYDEGYEHEHEHD